MCEALEASRRTRPGGPYGEWGGAAGPQQSTTVRSESVGTS